MASFDATIPFLPTPFPPSPYHIPPHPSGEWLPSALKSSVGAKAPAPSPVVEARRELLSKLTLSNKAIWDREHAREQIKSPWVIKVGWDHRVSRGEMCRSPACLSQFRMRKVLPLPSVKTVLTHSHNRSRTTPCAGFWMSYSTGGRSRGSGCWRRWQG